MLSQSELESCEHIPKWAVASRHVQLAKSRKCGTGMKNVEGTARMKGSSRYIGSFVMFLKSGIEIEIGNYVETLCIYRTVCGGQSEHMSR